MLNAKEARKMVVDFKSRKNSVLSEKGKVYLLDIVKRIEKAAKIGDSELTVEPRWFSNSVKERELLKECAKQLSELGYSAEVYWFSSNLKIWW